MTSCVPWWRWPSTRNKKQETPQNHRGQFRGCGKQHSSMQKPGIPPARIPEITKSSLHGMTFTLTLWSKHRQRRVATKVVRRTTAVKLESETWSKVKMTARLRHSGHTQSPLSSAFPIIILGKGYPCALPRVLKGTVPGVVHLNNDQSERAVRDNLQGHLS